jgi:hypothetical protein
VVVLAASVQDRDGAKSVLLDTYLRTPVRFVFADGGFAGRLLDWATRILRTTMHIVRKPANRRPPRPCWVPVADQTETRTGAAAPPDPATPRWRGPTTCWICVSSRLLSTQCWPTRASR